MVDAIRQECRGRPALCRGSGCPRKTPFLSFCLPPAAAREKKRGFWGHPRPRQGGPCTPSGHPPVKGVLPESCVGNKTRVPSIDHYVAGNAWILPYARQFNAYFLVSYWKYMRDF